MFDANNSVLMRPFGSFNDCLNLNVNVSKASRSGIKRGRKGEGKSGGWFRIIINKNTKCELDLTLTSTLCLYILWISEEWESRTATTKRIKTLSRMCKRQFWENFHIVSYQHPQKKIKKWKRKQKQSNTFLRDHSHSHFLAPFIGGVGLYSSGWKMKMNKTK